MPIEYTRYPQTPEGGLLKYFVDGERVGDLVFSFHPAENRWHLADIAVEDAWQRGRRGMHVGRELLEAFVNRVKQGPIQSREIVAPFIVHHETVAHVVGLGIFDPVSDIPLEITDSVILDAIPMVQFARSTGIVVNRMIIGKISREAYEELIQERTYEDADPADVIQIQLEGSIV